ncbi:MAG: hypothetical protein FVQ82_00420 [Planctomycetes bacterium]|nr:hypothetical protein [Planctomycetota bacterium]
MKKILVLICFGLLVVFGCRDDSGGGGGAAFEYDKVFKGDGLEVLVRVDRLKVSAVDTLLVELGAVGASETVVTFPDLSLVLEDFEVIDSQIVDDRLGDGGDVLRARRIRLEPMVVGKVSLPVLRFEYVLKGQTEAKFVETEAVVIEVASVLGDSAGEGGQIAEIEGVVGLRDYTVLMWGSIIALVVLVVIVAVVVIIIGRISRKKNVSFRVFRTAHQIALRRLKELEDEGLVSAGMLKIFYERVSNILRYYIEDRFTLKAPERTTEEFLFELKSASVLAEADKDSLEQFLRHCDLVKFAKHEPDGEQIRLTVDLVRDFIDRTQSDESLVVVEIVSGKWEKANIQYSTRNIE